MELAFLNPLLLWGALLAAVPLLVHLISRRRARKVRFSAIEFVLRSQRRSARQLRLRQILLLVARTLLILLAALAIAQPVLVPERERLGAQSKALALAVVVDESASMQTTLDGESAFERAVKIARERVLSLPEDTRVFGVACGAAPEELVSSPTFARAELVAALERRRVSFESSDLAACAQLAATRLAELEGEGERRVVVVSDLAAHAFKEAQASAPGVLVEFERVFDEEPPPNHAVQNPKVTQTGTGAFGGVRVNFDVFRGTGPEVDVAVDLLIDDARAARVTGRPGSPGKSARALSHAFNEDGASVAALVAEDDALAVDNVVRFPVSVVKPVRVLVVDGAPQPVPFRDEVYYLESALAAHKESRGRLAVKVLSPSALSDKDLVDTDVVVLANVPPLGDGIARAVVEFVRAGGGLFITCGDQIETAWFNVAFKDVLPGTLRGVKGQALLDDANVAEVLGLARFDERHKIFQGLSGGKDELIGLKRVRTETLMLLEPDPKVAREVIMRFTNEAPALLERRTGEGRVILWASSIDRDWSDLAIRPGFLPLAQQILLYLARAQGAFDVAFVTVGGSRVLLAPRGVEHLLVKDPLGEETKVAVNGEGSARFSATTTPGVYEVFALRGDERRALDNARFSVVTDPAESDLRLATEAQLEAATPKGAVSLGGSAQHRENKLWPYLLLALIAVVLFEAGLVRRAAR